MKNVRWLGIASVLIALLAGCARSSGVGGSVSTAPPPTCVASNGSGPTVIGPIASDKPGSSSHNYPWLATNLKLASLGYVEEEYFICGFSALNAGSYTTRMIVRRPTQAKNFNGTVLVEWLNVTAGFDQDLIWQRSHQHITDAGYIYVGVSAQRAAYYAMPSGMAAWSPTRYAQLNWPGGNVVSDLVSGPLAPAFSAIPVPTALLDLASYDIYTQALQSIRATGGTSPVGGLPVKQVIATGGSQSSGALDVYFTVEQPVYKAADVFMPVNLTSGSIGISQPTSFNFPWIADVVGTPVLLVNSETDVDFLYEPDTALFREWEVAGATHEDQDQLDYLQPLLQRDLSPVPNLTAGCVNPPGSRVHFKYVLNAAIDLAASWGTTGVAPPSQPRFVYGATGQLERDANNNVLGGIRLPQMAVPIATNNSINSGGTYCGLLGSYQPFSESILRSLYSSHADYVQQVNAAAAAGVTAGFMLQPDADTEKLIAQSANVPP